MSIRLILAIALVAAFQSTHADTAIHRDTVVANPQRDIIYEQPTLASSMGHPRFPIPYAHVPQHGYTDLLLREETRSKLGRAVLKYMPSRNHSMEKIYQRRRTASVI